MLIYFQFFNLFIYFCSLLINPPKNTLLGDGSPGVSSIINFVILVIFALQVGHLY
jgi:hypothetical protein